MLSPICDNTRLILGILAALGSILFAGLIGFMKADILNLYNRIFHRNQPPASPPAPSTPFRKIAKIFGWLFLVISLFATIGLGPYVAAVPSKTCVNLVISELVCDPEGDDLVGEYVKIHNLSEHKISLKDWNLCDYKSVHCFTFEDIAIQGQDTLTLWTKEGTDTASDLYFNEPKSIWNNDVDTAYLYDLKGQLIFQLPCP